MTESDAEFMTSHVASRDVPCVSCGYNLRGLVFGVRRGASADGAGAGTVPPGESAPAGECRCPECGKRLTRFHIETGRRAASLRRPRKMIHAGLACGFLVAGCMTLVLLRRWHEGWPRWAEPSTARCAGALGVSLLAVPMGIGWVKARNRLELIHSEEHERVLWLCAGAAWCLPLTSLALYSMPA